MPYLVNPHGRIVAVEDQEKAQELLQQVGFRQATPEEETDYQAKRFYLLEQMRLNALTQEQADKGIYMSTVSQGGKDGYGIASAKLLQVWEKMGMNISTYQNDQKIGFLFHSPQSLIRLENPFRIVYTMFESDKIPDDWKYYLEDADEVFVPSHWCMEVFQKGGVNAQVIPLGYDDKVFTYKERYVKREKREDFIFLHYNAFNARKGFLEVFQAFIKAFKPDEPVKLYLKTTVPNPHMRFPYITKLNYPNIIVDDSKMSDEQIAQLCQQSDCFVFPSRGEGFGIPPLEAMATGTPAIVPNAHGITEYFNSDYMYEVKVKETCPALYVRYKTGVGNMVVCDVDDLAEKMRYIYEHQEEAIEIGRKASQYVKQWTFQNTALRFKEVFDSYLQKPISDRQRGNNLLLEEVR